MPADRVGCHAARLLFAQLALTLAFVGLALLVAFQSVRAEAGAVASTPCPSNSVAGEGETPTPDACPSTTTASPSANEQSPREEPGEVGVDVDPPPPNASDARVELYQRLRDNRPPQGSFAPPEVMRVGDVATISFVLPRPFVERLTREISGSSGASNAVTGEATVAVLGGSRLQVTPYRNPTQSLFSEALPEWRFGLEATRAGSEEITLSVQIELSALSGASHRAIYDLASQVQIQSSLTRTILSFVQDNWQWIFGTLLVPLVAWLLRRRRGTASA